MKFIKKLCIFLLAFSLVLPIFSNIKAKADTSFSLENMSEDEIVDLIFDSCKGIYPKEGQTTEEWATYLSKKIPFLNDTQINDFKTYRWTSNSHYDFIVDYYYAYKINHINNFYIYYGQYAEAMDGSYHKSSNEYYCNYIALTFYINDDYKKANNIYDKIVKNLKLYYGKENIYDNKDINNNIWKFYVNKTIFNKNQYDSYGGCEYYNNMEYYSIFRLDKKDNYYSFSLYLINPDNINTPTDYAKSFLDDSDEFNLSDDEDEFSFDDEIELDDPVIKSITNKKGKKLVVKYSGDDSFDNKVYKIQISTNKNFKSSKEFETKKTSATISKLKKGKTYFVRIMYTVTEDGETVSSNWSKTKSIKIKK